MTKPAPSPIASLSNIHANMSPEAAVIKPAGPTPFVRKFNPVFVRNRHDGWTEAKQHRFIMALAESGCVADACRDVGMSTESAYKLRTRHDALDFRQAWDIALDNAVHRLGDAALSRAIHGVPVPHYYKGEVVGEHRRYDERLTQFILRYRDPIVYWPGWDKSPPHGHPEERAERLMVAMQCLVNSVRQKQSAADHAERVVVCQAVLDAQDELEAERAAKARAEAAYARDVARQAKKRAADDARAEAFCARFDEAERQRVDEARMEREAIDAAARLAAAEAATEAVPAVTAVAPDRRPDVPVGDGAGEPGGRDVASCAPGDEGSTVEEAIVSTSAAPMAGEAGADEAGADEVVPDGASAVAAGSGPEAVADGSSPAVGPASGMRGVFDPTWRQLRQLPRRRGTTGWRWARLAAGRQASRRAPARYGKGRAVMARPSRSGSAGP